MATYLVTDRRYSDLEIYNLYFEALKSQAHFKAKADTFAGKDLINGGLAPMEGSVEFIFIGTEAFKLFKQSNMHYSVQLLENLKDGGLENNCYGTMMSATILTDAYSDLKFIPPYGVLFASVARDGERILVSATIASK